MTYFDIWKWNEAEQTKIRAVEIKYLRAVSGVTIPGRVRNEEVYERCGMAERAEGMWSGGMGKKKYIEMVWTCEKNARG